eukprot:1140386-Rhodomonas_salina.2
MSSCTCSPAPPPLSTRQLTPFAPLLFGCPGHYPGSGRSQQDKTPLVAALSVSRGIAIIEHGRRFPQPETGCPSSV